MEFFSNAFGGGADGAQSSIMSFLPLILMFAVLYFIMIRPQMKRQKEHRNMLSAMAKGDEVVTNGGIVGKVTKVTDAYVGVEISEGTEITIQKAVCHDHPPERHDQVAVRPTSLASGAASVVRPPWPTARSSPDASLIPSSPTLPVRPSP